MTKKKKWVLFSVALICLAVGVGMVFFPSDELPLIELPASDPKDDRLAVILSGDGGWADLDKTIGTGLQRRGVSTLGVNCLRYFWKPRYPDAVAADLEQTLRRYLEAWQKQRLLLIGFSFGANWLPFLLNRFPEDLRNRVTQMVLLSPGEYANLSIQMGDWMRFDIHRLGALSTLDEANHAQVPILCIWGTEDLEKTICPTLSGHNVRKLPKPGGHHYDKNYKSNEDAILQ